MTERDRTGQSDIDSEQKTELQRSIERYTQALNASGEYRYLYLVRTFDDWENRTRIDIHLVVGEFDPEISAGKYDSEIDSAFDDLSAALGEKVALGLYTFGDVYSDTDEIEPMILSGYEEKFSPELQGPFALDDSELE